MPGAPTGVMVEAGIGLVTITWTAPEVDESESTTEADRRSAAEFYRYQRTTTADTTDPANPIPDFSSSQRVKIEDSDGSTNSVTVEGLTARTYYFRGPCRKHQRGRRLVR